MVRRISKSQSLQILKDSSIDTKSIKLFKKEVWSPPPYDISKFNMDGSKRGSPGQAGIGGVLRDSKGNVLCIFSYFIGTQDSNSSKILAIHKACCLCDSNAALREKKVVIVSDSSVAVAWVNNGDFGGLKHIGSIYDIREKISSVGS